MALPLPRTLSPSKIASFKDCALAFRFNAIDRIPEPPTIHTAKGTLVHRALERLYWFHEPGTRSPAVASHELALAWDELVSGTELDELGLTDAQRQALLDDAGALVENYLRLEDPDSVRAVGTELTLEAEVDGVHLRGIIDRLDLTPEGDFVVVDYKTGRLPSLQQEQSRFGGVQFYALLCEAVLGRRPVSVRLLYLREPLCIEADPSEQALRGLRRRTGAIWHAIERACETEDFRPKPSALCNWCSYRALCPAQGGDLALLPSKLSGAAS
ncbi:MAG: RecB family exonuclease [Acidimicrobiales bacterium]